MRCLLAALMVAILTPALHAQTTAVRISHPQGAREQYQGKGIYVLFDAAGNVSHNYRLTHNRNVVGVENNPLQLANQGEVFVVYDGTDYALGDFTITFSTVTFGRIDKVKWAKPRSKPGQINVTASSEETETVPYKDGASMSIFGSHAAAKEFIKNGGR